MSEALQFAIVVAVVAVATIYAVRAFWGQFLRSEDETGSCSNCPANEAARKNAGKKSEPSGKSGSSAQAIR